MKLTAELSRFRVKEGKTEVVEQWMDFLNEHMDKVLLTLDDEKMFVETIFKEELEGATYLYWYSVQGEAELNWRAPAMKWTKSIWSSGMTASIRLIGGWTWKRRLS